MEARIVVIENDDSIRDMFTLSFKREGWKVFSYAYADIDLSILKDQHPNLIILDFNSRDGTVGWSFLQTLKMDDATAHIPVLITSTPFSISAEIRDYLLTRYIDVVQKPFELSSLLMHIQKTLRQASEAEVLFSNYRTLPILVVDDADELRDTVTTILRFESYHVVTADNGLVALDRVSRADFCLILLDISMPIMDGYEFLTAYNKQLRPHSPVIILSGETDIDTHVLPSFVVGVIPKPYGINELLTVVEQYAQPV